MENSQKGPYEVGYGKPPKSGQFKQGNRANPLGRRPSTISGWAKEFGAQDYISATVTVSKDNVPKTIDFSIRNGQGPINALVALQLIKGACEGDLYFIKELMDRTEGKAPQTVTINKPGTTVIKPDDDGGIIIEEEFDEHEGEDDGYDDFEEIDEDSDEDDA